MNILITGANRGLGYHLAKVGLERGHFIFASVRTITPQSIQQLEKLKNDYPQNIEMIELDVSSEESVKQAAQIVAENEQHLDSIINNAGILLERDKQIDELDIDEVTRSLDINTIGPIRVIKHFLALVEKGKKQSIINISSEAGSLTNAYSGDFPYGLSKAALNMLSEKLHVSLKDKDIQVYSIHPGWMKTDMGGGKAPTEPSDTAKGIFEIIERKLEIQSQYVFIDYKGQPMTI